MLFRSRAKNNSIAVALLAASLLAGCADRPRDLFAESKDERVNAYPDNYKAEMLAFFRTYLNDPSGIRDASIASPELKNIGERRRYVVCVRFSAKNSEGRYRESRDGMAIFRDGRFEQFAERAREQCEKAAYQPFPDLEKLSR
jgi:hypothetical protein